MPRFFAQGANDRLEYKFDFDTNFLVGGDTIESYTLDEDEGITLDAHSVTDDATTITVWLTGGTAYTHYRVRVHVVTVAGREKERTITMRVQ